jgi:hypothetical protein
MPSSLKTLKFGYAYRPILPIENIPASLTHLHIPSLEYANRIQTDHPLGLCSAAFTDGYFHCRLFRNRINRHRNDIFKDIHIHEKVEDNEIIYQDNDSSDEDDMEEEDEDEEEEEEADDNADDKDE